MFVSNKIMKREEKKTYQRPKGRPTTSLGPSFVASPSSAALPFSRFVAAPVPTPRAVARGRSWGVVLVVLLVVVVVVVPVLVRRGCPALRGRPRPLVSSSSSSPLLAPLVRPRTPTVHPASRCSQRREWVLGAGWPSSSSVVLPIV